jgi:hypothetical protein
MALQRLTENALLIATEERGVVTRWASIGMTGWRHQMNSPSS